MTSLILLLSFWAAPQQVADPVADLAAARALYASAEYEEALDRLGRISGAPRVQDQIDTYRALCLMALGRTPESERVLEQLLQRNPRHVLDETDVSPRLVMMFRAVRSRLLPVAARNLYSAARASFDAREYDTAVLQLREVLAMVGPQAGNDAAITDLRMLAEGFLRLAESVQSGGVPPPENAQRSITFGVVTPGIVFSVLDRDVVAPVEVSRPVPIMEAPRGTMPGLYQGLVEVVINELGRVESAVIRRSIAPAFDAEILTATERWRFQPASRYGQTVKYRRSYEIIGHSR